MLKQENVCSSKPIAYQFLIKFSQQLSHKSQMENVNKQIEYSNITFSFNADD